MNTLAPVLLDNSSNILSNATQTFQNSPQNGAFLALYRQQMLGYPMNGNGMFGSGFASPMMMGNTSPSMYGMMLPPMTSMSSAYLSLQSSMTGGLPSSYGNATIGDILRSINPETTADKTNSAGTTNPSSSTSRTALADTSTSPLLAALQAQSTSQPQLVADKFANRIDHLAKQGITDVALTVDNQQYGPIGVDLKIDGNGGVDLKLQTENPQLAEWLGSLQSQLQQSLGNNGLSLKSLTVDKSAPPESIALNRDTSINQSPASSPNSFNLIDYYLTQAMNQNALNFVNG